MRLERLDLDGLARAAAEWESLAATGSPFKTAAWLESWWRSFAPDTGVALALRDGGGELQAGGCFLDAGRGALEAAVNAHSNDWGIVARDREAAASFWAEVAALGYRRLALRPLLTDGPEAAVPGEVLGKAGYRMVEGLSEPSPWLELPDSLEALLASRSRNLRSQVGRRRRGLQREGELKLRVVRGGTTLERDLHAFFKLEAAGWKGEEGTAIAADPALVELYRGFASRAADRGWLRLYMLELDDRLVAADYGCAFDGCGYLVKTAFDEDLGRLAPGLVLRAEVLDSSIEEGLTRYDFLGGPDPYKLRWADNLRGRSTLRAFRGLSSLPARTWWSTARPALKRVRDMFAR